MTAHPRAGGENVCRAWTSLLIGGSSPRGRGKHVNGELGSHIAGLIPARAGKTLISPLISRPAGAHPRAGGENLSAYSFAAADAGSSPRGRGKPVAGDRGEPGDGLIPARAGKTRTSAPSRPSPSAHPRAGGENCTGRRIRWAVRGSSPRGRGKRDNLPHRVRRVRLIPARAGKTPRSKMRPPWRPAHPRAGGENATTPMKSVRAGGSSPRGRGKPKAGFDLSFSRRLIPARAGKTVYLTSKRPLRAAHPRAGGENPVECSTGRPHLGSSPRGRGKLATRARAAGRARPRGRLIPARAGKTSSRSRPDTRRRAHPRAGGENRRARSSTPAAPGSSPRGRGKR